MRFSVLLTAAFSAFAFANPSAPVAAKREAAPVPVAAPALDSAALNAFVSRSIEERQSLLDVSKTLAEIGPTIKALGQLLTAQTLTDIKSVVSHAAILLDDQGTAATKNVLLQANRLLTPANTDTLVGVFNDVAPLLKTLGPAINRLMTVLEALAGLFGV